MKILVMGGTRFVGKSLVGKLLSKNYDIDIFTRGNKSNPEKTNLIKGDRNNSEDIVKLRNEKYDVVFDISGRELEQTKLLIENLDNSFQRYIYVALQVFIKIIVNYLYPKLIQLIKIVGTKESLRQKIG